MAKQRCKKCTPVAIFVDEFGDDHEYEYPLIADNEEPFTQFSCKVCGNDLTKEIIEEQYSESG